ncbi:MAG: SUMF1/EgtB/PvdO family nonheme iron enzyme [Chloroflexaceae bacterium]|nr:SUMF1/EgtB/PvdO family nonheme iron enzyme [Chloroflexaceae bacterium]
MGHHHAAYQPQSDLYSLAASLYHLLTGQPPTPVTDRIATLKDPLVAPAQQNPRISAHVSAAIMQALAIQPQHRHANARAFKQALLTGSTTPKPRAQTTRMQKVFGRPSGYWCYVRPNTYRIGGWKEDQACADIRLAEFWIARYPISVAQYTTFVAAGGYADQGQAWWPVEGWQWKQRTQRMKPDNWQGMGFNGPDQPVIGVNWYEAVAFCNWLHSTLHNDLPPNYVIRLPTEAEWEVAAAYDATGQRRTYPWGETPPTPAHAIYNTSDRGRQSHGPTAIGSCPQGVAACGAEELAGNIWEWCSSPWDNYPTASNHIQTDGSPGEYVSLKGGSWLQNNTYLTCMARNVQLRFEHSNYYGFRLVLAPGSG